MTGLCWMAVAVAFSLSIGNSVAVDQNWLIERVKDIVNRYFIPNMQFSLAANIPVDQNQLANAFNADKPDDVKAKVRSGEVYVGTNVVEATFKRGALYTDHAENRVLDKINPLVVGSKGNVLIFYSYLSPCGAKCANKGHPNNILKKLKDTIAGADWEKVALVFSKVYDGVITEDDIKESLQNLGGSVGQGNIFRCYKPYNRVFTCIRCFSNGNLAEACFKN